LNGCRLILSLGGEMGVKEMVKFRAKFKSFMGGTQTPLYLGILAFFYFNVYKTGNYSFTFAEITFWTFSFPLLVFLYVHGKCLLDCYVCSTAIFRKTSKVFFIFSHILHSSIHFISSKVHSHSAKDSSVRVELFESKNAYKFSSFKKGKKLHFLLEQICVH